MIGLSVLFTPRKPQRPISVMPQTDGAMFYQLYYQAAGVVEADLETDIRTFLRGNLWANSGDGPVRNRPDRHGAARASPAGEMGRRGVGRGPQPTVLDQRARYRLLRRRVRPRRLSRRRQLLPHLGTAGPYAGAQVAVPALYMVGEYDLTLGFEGMTDLVANLHQTIILPGCGHWTQQERADQMSAAMIEFLVARTPLHPTVI